MSRASNANHAATATGLARYARFLKFCIVGGVGFVVDASVLQALVSWAGWNPYGARIVSFVCAATATWALNRSFTFRVQHKTSAREWSHYLLLMCLGAAANYGAFVLTLVLWGTARSYPVLGVVAGSLAGMFINYAGMKRLFARPPVPPPDCD